MPQPVYSFDVAQVGDTYQFTYKKAKFGLAQVWPYLLIVGLICSILTGMMTEKNGFIFWLLLMTVFAAAPILIMNAVRKGGAFSISKDAITVGGQRYDRKHIGQLFIKEPNMPEEATIITVGRPSFSSASARMSQDTRRAIRKQIAKNSWQIGFRYAEKRVKLASGLREDTAEVLYERVLTILKNDQ